MLVVTCRTITKKCIGSHTRGPASTPGELLVISHCKRQSVLRYAASSSPSARAAPCCLSHWLHKSLTTACSPDQAVRVTPLLPSVTSCCWLRQADWIVIYPFSAYVSMTGAASISPLQFNLKGASCCFVGCIAHNHRYCRHWRFIVSRFSQNVALSSTKAKGNSVNFCVHRRCSGPKIWVVRREEAVH